jgi:hypothetical protein
MSSRKTTTTTTTTTTTYTTFRPTSNTAASADGLAVCHISIQKAWIRFV